MISKKKYSIFSTPRINRYFQDSPALYLPYTKAVDQVWAQGCRDVGIYMSYNDWDYPLWVLMQDKPKTNFRLEHLYFDAESPRKYPLGDFTPCAVIGIDIHDEQIKVGVREFALANDYHLASVYFLRRKDQFFTIKYSL